MSPKWPHTRRACAVQKHDNAARLITTRVAVNQTSVLAARSAWIAVRLGLAFHTPISRGGSIRFRSQCRNRRDFMGSRDIAVLKASSSFAIVAMQNEKRSSDPTALGSVDIRIIRGAVAVSGASGCARSTSSQGFFYDGAEARLSSPNQRFRRGPLVYATPSTIPRKSKFKRKSGLRRVVSPHRFAKRTKLTLPFYWPRRSRPFGGPKPGRISFGVKLVRRRVYGHRLVDFRAKRPYLAGKNFRRRSVI